MKKIVLLHVTWMSQYKGDTDTTDAGGFKHPKKSGFGHEMFNFKTFRGKCYGFVQADKRLNLQRLGADKGANSASGVTVVWTAPHPEKGGRCVVGTYRNATIFAEHVDAEGQLAEARMFRRRSIGYRVVATSSDCEVLDPLLRPQLMSAGEAGRKGWPGQTTVFYLKPNTTICNRLTEILDKEFPQRELRNMRALRGNAKNRSRWQADVERRSQIEKAAVSEVSALLESYGYSVKSVEAEKCGYDIEATMNGEMLQVEVKGRSGDCIDADFTANEFRCIRNYQKSKLKSPHYRIFIVTDVLNSPKLHHFYYSRKLKQWKTFDEELTLEFAERIAARAEAN